MFITQCIAELYICMYIIESLRIYKLYGLYFSPYISRVMEEVAASFRVVWTAIVYIPLSSAESFKMVSER